jgi:hypothetical protein
MKNLSTLQRRDLRQGFKILQCLLNSEALEFLLSKDLLLMWKIKCLEMICSTAFSPEGEGEG